MAAVFRGCHHGRQIVQLPQPSYQRALVVIQRWTLNPRFVCQYRANTPYKIDRTEMIGNSMIYPTTHPACQDCLGSHASFRPVCLIIVTLTICLISLANQPLLAQSLSPPADAAITWPWRGPGGDGKATDDQRPPTKWDLETGLNVRYRVPVPGRGHSSPIIAGGRIFLTTAELDSRTQRVLCYHADTGQLLWNEIVNEGGFLSRIHPTNTHASSSVAVIGDRVFALFTNRDEFQVVALSVESGRKLWDRRAAKYGPAKYQFGNGSSLIAIADQLVVTVETEAEAAILFLDSACGKELRRIERPAKTSYSTPVVAEIAGKKQLLISGGSKVVGYDPESGQELWQIPAAWEVSCGTMVWSRDRQIVYASGGFPASQTLAIKVGDRAELLWDNRVKCYEQSLIVVGDELYGFAEGGILYCWDAATGKEWWSKRLKGGESASPVLAGGHLYISNELGTTWVIEPSRDGYREIVRNQLGDEQFTSIAVDNQRLFFRVADSTSGTRQEFLICVGEDR